EEFCGFLNLGLIRERIESAVANFKPRKQTWFANLRPKLELCAGPKNDHYSRWIRRLTFIFLLDEEKAREGFKDAIKADPARMTEYQMQHARILFAEGKTDQFVAETNAIINQKPKATEDYKKNLLWAHVFLGSYKVAQGEFD